MLPPSFFARPVLTVAEELLGSVLVRRTAGGEERGLLITETEAYDGPDDRACHAWRGKTSRNAPMFGPPGHWYVYLVYGMHWMLNVVTDREGYPAAVLLRGTEQVAGPGRLTRTLGITGALSGRPLSRETGLWIASGPDAHFSVRRTPRIGVDYAGEWAAKPYRFVLDANGREAEGSGGRRIAEGKR